MSALIWFLILLGPFLVVAPPAVVAFLEFGGRQARRPVFASMAPAGGGWS